MSAIELESRQYDRWKRPTLIVGGFLLAAGMAAVATKDATMARSPFVWLDVAVVSLLCAMPFAVAVTERLAGAIPRVVAIVGSLFLLGAVREMMDPDATSRVLFDWRSSEWGLAAVRIAISVAACLGGTMLVAALRPRNRAANAGSGRGGLVTCLLLFAIAAGVPESYLDARCRRERERMREFSTGGRTVDASRIARSLEILRPGSRVEAGSTSGEVSIAELARELSRHAEALRRQLDSLPETDDPRVRLQRARLLARLSRRREAIRELAPVADAGPPSQQIEACLLLGTIHEHAEDWGAGRRWYDKASELAANSTPRPEKRLLATALKGVAFTSRKLGRYAEAESAYQKLITLAPTAENHFLLAQFYDDAQQGEKAQRHARQAIRLAPHRFTRSGEQLIDRVVTTDFGCFSAFLREIQAR
jgi:Tetratricopeptide repeat